jgi:hypothetical protein
MIMGPLEGASPFQFRERGAPDSESMTMKKPLRDADAANETGSPEWDGTPRRKDGIG